MVELKAVIQLEDVHLAQALNYRPTVPEPPLEIPVLPEGEATQAAAPTAEPSTNFWGRLRPSLPPLLTLAVFTGLILLIIPAFNYAASGDLSKNLYTLVWSYDQVGFGEGYGRHGHTLEKGLRQTRWDLSLTAADLFGCSGSSRTTSRIFSRR